MTALLLEMLLFQFRAACELQLTSYGPKMHSSLFRMHHFVCISSITWKPQGACNSATQQTTPLLPRMLRLMLKAANQLQPRSYGFVHTCTLLSLFVCKYAWQRNSGHLQLCCKLQMTTLLPRLHLVRSTRQGTTYELPSWTSIYLLLCLCE